MGLTLPFAEFRRKLFRKWSLCCTWGVGCHSSDVSTSGTDSCEADEKGLWTCIIWPHWKLQSWLPQDRPLVRRMKVPQNLHHLPPLGVVGLVLPIELKKKCTLPQKIIYLRCVRFPFLSSKKPIKHAKKKIYLTRLFSGWSQTRSRLADCSRIRRGLKLWWCGFKDESSTMFAAA